MPTSFVEEREEEEEEAEILQKPPPSKFFGTIGQYGPLLIFLVLVVVTIVMLVVAKINLKQKSSSGVVTLLWIGGALILFAMVAEWTFIGSLWKYSAFKLGCGSTRPKFENVPLTLKTNGMPSSHAASAMVVTILGTFFLGILFTYMSIHVGANLSSSSSSYKLFRTVSIICITFFAFLAVGLLIVTCWQRHVFQWHSKSQIATGIVLGVLTCFAWVGLAMLILWLVVKHQEKKENHH